jgi:hypothetical protein
MEGAFGGDASCGCAQAIDGIVNMRAVINFIGTILNVRKKQYASSTKQDVVTEFYGLHPADKNKDVLWTGHSFILCRSMRPVNERLVESSRTGRSVIGCSVWSFVIGGRALLPNYRQL